MAKYSYPIHSQIKLGKYFKLDEFMRSASADRLKINLYDYLTDDVYNNLKRLVVTLDKIREQFHAPINISSGFRCFAVNVDVGGVPGSHHLKGDAADIYASNVVETRRLYNIVSKHNDIGYCYIKRTRKGAYIHLQLDYFKEFKPTY